MIPRPACFSSPKIGGDEIRLDNISGAIRAMAPAAMVPVGIKTYAGVLVRGFPDAGGGGWKTLPITAGGRDTAG
ncbi:hypothetical protein GCM10009744_40800 [Kribbella alba]|uniref:Uncharacterized protein n=1 Tax=Kribbella alba TaxID=190197 RepID=A0ABN2FGE8_9ACTN